MSAKPGDVATEHNIGLQLMQALGLRHGTDKQRWITRIVIDVKAASLVEVQVTEEIRVDTAEEIVKTVSNYKLVPKDQ